MGKAQSEATQVMDEVQAGIRPFLRELGWRARARAFNRTTSDGLTHVIEFQMGRFDPSGTHDVGFRRNLYGKFTVNVGVYVPEVDEYTTSGGGKRSFVHEYDCCIRRRIGNLGAGQQDVWWNLEAPHEQAAEVFRRIEKDAFPFFAQLETRDAILSQWNTGKFKPYSGGNPPRIVCAIILAGRGRRAEARSFLATQAMEHINHPHFAWVLTLADKLGLGKLDI